jgi:hypothetical protein
MKIENLNIRIVQESLLPRECRLAGWAALGMSYRAPRGFDNPLKEGEEKEAKKRA